MDDINFKSDLGLTRAAYDELLRRVAPALTRMHIEKAAGQGGALSPGIKLMITLRWLRGSRITDMKDVFFVGTYARARLRHAPASPQVFAPLTSPLWRCPPRADRPQSRRSGRRSP